MKKEYKTIPVKLADTLIGAIDTIALDNFKTRTDIVRLAIIYLIRNDEKFPDLSELGRGEKHTFLFNFNPETVNILDDIISHREHSNRSKAIYIACRYLINHKKKFNLK